VSTLRRLIPYALLPLALLATGLASGLWLRAFPASVLAAPLIGACVISVLLPVAVSGLFTARLWVTALLDLVVLVLYLLFVVLRDPVGFGDLWTGLVHGPSQLLTFALPLVSPRTLLVAPVVLCWVCGAIAGECIGRGWQTVLPYLAWLTTFGLTYAGTARAISSASAGRRQDTLIGAALLLVLLVVRAAQAWVGQDESAEVTQASGVLPVRGFVVGSILALALAAGAAGAVQSATFAGPPETPQRVPSVDKGQPLTPLSFVNGLRQQVLAGEPARPVFRVHLGGAAQGYFAIASVDYYDGDAWSFDRTFRPSGGVIPGETDPGLRTGSTVRQSYRLEGPVLSRTPWMPYVARPARVSGLGIDVDPASGMIVPAEPLPAGKSYTVSSRAPAATFDSLGTGAFPASSAGPADRGVPGQLRAELGTLIASLADETGAPSAPAIPFLQAVAADLRAHYGLSGKKTAPSASPSASRSSAASGAHRHPTPRSVARSQSRTRSAAPSSSATSAPPGARAGGTAFRDVVESILGDGRAGTPEQYATLVALVARQLGVPARVATGFRVLPAGSSGPLPAGTYDVTTADAWTWVEVPVHGKGWVVLDAAPSTYSGSRQSASVGAEPSHTPSSSSAPNALVTTDNRSGQAVAPRSTVPHSQLTTTDVLVIVLAALAALAVGIVAVLLLRKRWRAARRRRASDPRLRLLGAWQESIDVLVESGLPEPEAMTSAEIAGAASAQFGDGPGRHVAELGDAANRAIFSPTSWVSSAEADAAWSQHWLLRTEVHRSLRLRDRVAAGVRYHHLRRHGPLSGPASWADKAPSGTDARRRRGPRHLRRH
jgi:hypothetical protein